MYCVAAPQLQLPTYDQGYFAESPFFCYNASGCLNAYDLQNTTCQNLGTSQCPSSQLPQNKVLGSVTQIAADGAFPTIKTVVSTGRPVAIKFYTNNYFKTVALTKIGLSDLASFGCTGSPLPVPNHVMLIIGWFYNNQNKSDPWWIVQNSWVKHTSTIYVRLWA